METSLVDIHFLLADNSNKFHPICSSETSILFKYKQEVLTKKIVKISQQQRLKTLNNWNRKEKPTNKKLHEEENSKENNSKKEHTQVKIENFEIIFRLLLIYFFLFFSFRSVFPWKTVHFNLFFCFFYLICEHLWKTSQESCKKNFKNSLKIYPKK